MTTISLMYKQNGSGSVKGRTFSKGSPLFFALSFLLLSGTNLQAGDPPLKFETKGKKTFAFSYQNAKFEEACFKEAKRLVEVARSQQKANPTIALDTCEKALLALKLPIHYIEPKEYVRFHFQKTATLGAKIFDFLIRLNLLEEKKIQETLPTSEEENLKDSRAPKGKRPSSVDIEELFALEESASEEPKKSNPHNWHSLYFSSDRTFENPLISLLRWKAQCLLWAGVAKDAEKKVKEVPHLSPFRLEVNPITAEALKLALKEIESTPNGILKARKLERASGFALSLYRNFIKYDGNKEDLSVAKKVWPEYEALCDRAAEEFLRVGLEEEDVEAYNKSEAANHYFHGIQLFMRNGWGAGNQLRNILRSIIFTRTGLQRFGAKVVRKCDYFYERGVAENRSSSLDPSGPNMTFYLPQRAYNLLWQLFRKKVKAYTGSPETARNELWDPFCKEYAMAIRMLAPEQLPRVEHSICPYKYVDYKKELFLRMEETLQKIKPTNLNS